MPEGRSHFLIHGVHSYGPAGGTIQNIDYMPRRGWIRHDSSSSRVLEAPNFLVAGHRNTPKRNKKRGEKGSFFLVGLWRGKGLRKDCRVMVHRYFGLIA